MLANWRKQIDEIDAQIINLIADRMIVVKEIGEYKKLNQIEVVQKGRWNELLSLRKNQANKLGLKEKLIEDIWNQFHEYAIDIEENVN